MKKLSIAIATAVTALGFATTATAADKVLTASHWAGPKHTMATHVFPWIGEQLKECSGGSLTVKIENGLAPPPAQYDTIRDGVADLGWIVHGYTPGKFKTTKLAELPGVPGNAESISVAFQMTHEKYLAAAKEAKDVQVLANFVHGPGMLNTVKEVLSYKDIKGMKLRVGGGVANLVGKTLGVAGVNVPAPAVYETIASGVAEGVFFPAETLYSFKVAELTKYALSNPDGMYTTSFGLIMSDESYNGLSDEHKACVDGMRGVEMARRIGQFWDQADLVGIAAAQKDFGLQLNEASDEARAYYKEATAGIRADVLKEVDSREIDGTAQEALDYMLSNIK